MKYSLRIIPAAEREMRNLPPLTLRRVHLRILRLQENPFAPGTRKLSKRLGYRVRVGGYRIIFTVEDNRTVVITAVRHRRDAYR